jgi:TPR repeat protein
VQSLIEKGNGLLANGDVLAARQFYLKAYGLKAPEAAYGVGQTYDPSVYKQHNIKGLAADPKTAAEWYGKAAAAGFESAQAALAHLPLQP